MKVLRCFAFALPFGLLPVFCSAEVCFDGMSKGLAPLLGGCDLWQAFDRSFGPGTGIRLTGPFLGESSSGRPQASFYIAVNDLKDLEASISKVGGDLEGAIKRFDANTRGIACGGAYDRYLDAGGSLAVTLSASKKSDGKTALSLGGESVVLMDIEIDTLTACEAN
jgi:hypothetical protein